MKRLLLIVVLLAFVTGCATAKPLQTPSGRPEVTIIGATKKEISDVLVSTMLSAGVQMKQITEYTLVFAIRDTSLTGAIFFGSKYDTSPEMRITFSMIEECKFKSTRVFCTAVMVTNPGSAFERVSDVTQANSMDIQNMLEKLKGRTQKY
jgi:hypothetical protein